MIKILCVGKIKEKYLKAGFDEYMPKPIDIYQFDSIIKKYCHKK